jgi:hypothetical protein
MFDLAVQEFKEKVVNDINGSGLPMTAVSYILQEILQQVIIVSQRQIEEQKKQRDAEKSAEQE